GHQVPAAGVAERLRRVLLNVPHRDGHARGVGQGEVVLGRARLGDRDRDLPGPAAGVILAGFLFQHGSLVPSSMCTRPAAVRRFSISAATPFWLETNWPGPGGSRCSSPAAACRPCHVKRRARARALAPYPPRCAKTARSPPSPRATYRA